MSRIRVLVLLFIGLLLVVGLNLEFHEAPLLSIHFTHQELVGLRQVVLQRVQLLLEKGDIRFQALAVETRCIHNETILCFSYHL